MNSVQILVKLDNVKTYCLNFTDSETCSNYVTNNADDTNDCSISSSSSCIPISNSSIVNKLSIVTGIPAIMLKIQNTTKNSSTNILIHKSQHENKKNKLITTNWQFFLSASTFIPIRGGKGGFGTLLKGQSKQAGAKRTLDFGACRDLNGRRLRHVNDEIKLRKWRESVQKRMERSIANGEEDSIDIDEEMKELQTASGIRNWHLMIPNWSDIGGGGLTSKSRRSIERGLRREVEKMARQKREEYERRMKKKNDWEQSIAAYVNAGEQSAKEQHAKMTNSILEGLSKRKKRKMEKKQKSVEETVEEGLYASSKCDPTDEDNDIDTTSLLATSNICTLSGDVMIEDQPDDQDSSQILIQSKSEFATVAIILNISVFHTFYSTYHGLFYEVTIRTSNIAQLGWALLSVAKDGTILPSNGKDRFLPNSDTGDGVGDDEFSYGYDGSRSLTFHNGKEQHYGNTDGWKEGDIVGCMYDFKNGLIEFSINGKNCGVAFEVQRCETDNFEKQLLHPSFSLNDNEIIGLNTGPIFRHCPDGYLGVGALIESQNTIARNKNFDGDSKQITIDSKESSINTHLQKISEGLKEVKDEIDRIPSSSNRAADSKDEGINLDNYTSAKELEAFGGDRLKNALFALGCKCGGTTQERAFRLFSTKGLRKDQYPAKIKGKQFSDI